MVRVSSRLHEVSEPYLRLWLMVLDRARRDALKGDLDAIGWLYLTGCEIADFIADGQFYKVRKFAESQLKAHYGELDEATAVNYGLPFHRQ